MSLFGVKIESYLSVLHHFHHRTNATKSKLLTMILGFLLLTLTLQLYWLALGKLMSIMSNIVLMQVTQQKGLKDFIPIAFDCQFIIL